MLFKGEPRERRELIVILCDYIMLYYYAQYIPFQSITHNFSRHFRGPNVSFNTYYEMCYNNYCSFLHLTFITYRAGLCQFVKI